MGYYLSDSAGAAPRSPGTSRPRSGQNLPRKNPSIKALVPYFTARWCLVLNSCFLTYFTVGVRVRVGLWLGFRRRLGDIVHEA